jgi:hypothetical protein
MNHDVKFTSIVNAHLTVRDVTARVAGSHDPTEIAGALRSLARVLPAHFHAEEQVDGFFDHLRRSLDDDAEEEIEALALEHVVMERDLSELLGPGSHDDGWVARAKDLVRRLQDHERREARLGVAGFETY